MGDREFLNRCKAVSKLPFPLFTEDEVRRLLRLAGQEFTGPPRKGSVCWRYRQLAPVLRRAYSLLEGRPVEVEDHGDVAQPFEPIV